MSTTDHYDQMYECDNPNRSPIARTARPTNRLEFGILASGRGKRVLDVGCGDGQVLWNLRSSFQELHGTEASRKRARVASETVGDHGLCVIGHGTSLPYRSGMFDQALVLDVLEHVVDARGLFQEVSRVLAEGGRIVVTTPNIAFLPRRVQLLLGRFPSTSQPNEGFGTGEHMLLDGGHVHYFTHAMLVRLLRETGFGKIHTAAVGRWQRSMAIWPTVLSPTIGLTAFKVS